MTRRDGRYGPIFGKDAKHQFILTNAGVIESTDARCYLVEAAGGSEGTERCLLPDVARLRPQERHTLCDEDDV